jgi:hypothetical protein
MSSLQAFMAVASSFEVAGQGREILAEAVKVFMT